MLKLLQKAFRRSNMSRPAKITKKCLRFSTKAEALARNEEFLQPKFHGAVSKYFAHYFEQDGKFCLDLTGVDTNKIPKTYLSKIETIIA